MIDDKKAQIHRFIHYISSLEVRLEYFRPVSDVHLVLQKGLEPRLHLDTWSISYKS